MSTSMVLKLDHRTHDGMLLQEDYRVVMNDYEKDHPKPPRRQKRARDPAELKRPQSAYFFFLADFRELFKVRQVLILLFFIACRMVLSTAPSLSLPNLVIMPACTVMCSMWVRPCTAIHCNQGASRMVSLLKSIHKEVVRVPAAGSQNDLLQSAQSPCLGTSHCPNKSERVVLKSLPSRAHSTDLLLVSCQLAGVTAHPSLLKLQDMNACKCPGRCNET